MAFDGPTRRDILRQADAALVYAAQLDPAALAAAMDGARAALRRACALGQASGGAARAPALSALAGASRAVFGQLPGTAEMGAALAMYLGYAVDAGYRAAAPLAVALCAVLECWSGRNCHVVCASDLAAARDAVSFQPLFQLCGCSSAALGPSMPAPDAEQAYASDIMYGGARQLLSDSMRDQLQLDGATSPIRRQLRAASGSRAPLVRATGVAIVADIEAVMADDASSPVMLSASGQLTVLNVATLAALELVASLHSGADYTIDTTYAWQVQFTPSGERHLHQLAATLLPVYWRHPLRCADLVGMAILARDVLEPERHYVVQEGRVMIADENVTRMLAGRVWQQGPLQALEARAQVALSTPPRTIARAAFQSFFPRYERLAGVGRNLDGLGRELRSCYALSVLSLREQAGSAPAQARYEFADREAKLEGFVDLIVDISSAGTAVVATAPRSADLAAVGRALVDRGVAFQLVDGRDRNADTQTLANASGNGKVTLVAGSSLRSGELDVSDDMHVRPLLLEHWDLRRTDLAFFALGEGAVVFAAHAELMSRPLPAWGALLRTLLRYPASATFAARHIVSLSQWHVNRYGSRYRESMAARESQLDEQLAFSRKA
jgi:preprotein translocase subunit SecA